MKLKDLVANLYPRLPSQFEEFDVEQISCDSRQVKPQSLFVAVPGITYDGANFIDEAIDKGAIVVAYDHHAAKKINNDQVCALQVSDPKRFLHEIIQRFYDYPSKKVKTIGVTGTNGKTTITYLIESVFKTNDKRCAVIGTINHRIAGNIIPSKNTTPGVVELQQYLFEMDKAKVAYCVMEVSSHALEQERVAGIDFRSAIFTNLTQDHLDYHVYMDNYFYAKAKLFTALSADSYALINTDDHFARKLIGLTKSRVMTYGIKNQADIQARDIHLTLRGSTFTVCDQPGRTKIQTRLMGTHNIYNILAAWGVCLSEGISPENIKKGIEAFDSVPGRLERIDCGQDFFVYVDYAHTDDALKNVLTSFKQVSSAKVIVVFGCGGNRDKMKRPKMGEVASQLADYVIVTSDNPRQEDPQAIIGEIIAGFKGNHYAVVLDRKEAIAKAFSLVQKGEIVLIAGKGHEDYQIFKDKTIHFDDREIARECLQCLV